MVQIVGVPGCCVAAQLYDFGGSPNRGSTEGNIPIAQVKDRVADLIAGFSQHSYKLDKQGVVTAYLTTAQENAEQALTEIGFEPGPSFSKPKHPESDIRVWSIHAPKVYAWAIEHQQAARSKKTTKIMGSSTAPVPPMPAVNINWDEDFEEEDI